MRFLGVYRTEPELDDEDDTGERAGEPASAWLCIRRSEWVRSVDQAQARAADDLGDYLATGPQLSHRFCFGTARAHAEVVDATVDTLQRFAAGFTIAAHSGRQTSWHQVSVEIADDHFFPFFSYSRLLAQCAIVETHLPAWLDVLDHAAQQQGAVPGGDIRLANEPSVRELINGPFRPTSGRPRYPNPIQDPEVGWLTKRSALTTVPDRYPHDPTAIQLAGPHSPASQWSSPDPRRQPESSSAL